MASHYMSMSFIPGKREKIIKRFTSIERPSSFTVYFYRGEDVLLAARRYPTWRSVGSLGARLRLHSGWGSTVTHAHETSVSHFYHGSGMGVQFMRSFHTAWGIWRRMIANCKNSGSKTKLIRDKQSSFCFRPITEWLMGSTMTWFMSGVRERNTAVSKHRWLLHSESWDGGGAHGVPGPNRLKCQAWLCLWGEKDGNEGSSCGHTVRVRDGQTVGNERRA